jgi:uncharacterized repeat protein (TIGR01451 family)
MMHRWLAYLAALCAVVLVVGPGVASAATSEGAVVSNGVVQLGVTKWGDLNYNCNGNGDADCPADSAAGNTPLVGIRFVPLNTEATADGCPCEGWGVADVASGLAGHANEQWGTGNVTPVSLVATPTTVVVTTDISDGALPGFELRVVHDYHPSAVSPNLYEVTVRITNTGTQNVADLRYRRVMDWDIEPTPTSEWVTIANTSASRQLLFDSDGGFATGNPLDPGLMYQESESVCGTGYTGLCEFSNLGSGGVYPGQTQPSDHGALFDFGFGALAPGQTRIFQTYYGAAPSRAVALSAVTAQGIGVYSLGEPDCGANGNTTGLCTGLGAFEGVDAGLPNTFTFGFLTNDADLSTTAGTPAAAVLTGQQTASSFTVTNTGPDGAPGATLTIPLPEGVDYVSAVPSQGSCTYSAPNVVCSLGALVNGASATVLLTTTQSRAGSYALAGTVATPANDAVSANDTASLSLLASDPPATVAQPAAPNQVAAPHVAAPFMVQVQFRIPSTCAMPCKLRAQLFLRTGKTQLGSRSRLSISTAGQVRFFVPIDKSVLLAGAGIVDAKGYRTTLTRLIVWTRAANGGWTSTVKQGHISIAIDRLTSGGLPSVQGKVF